MQMAISSREVIFAIPQAEPNGQSFPVLSQCGQHRATITLGKDSGLRAIVVTVALDNKTHCTRAFPVRDDDLRAKSIEISVVVALYKIGGSKEVHDKLLEIRGNAKGATVSTEAVMSVFVAAAVSHGLLIVKRQADRLIDSIFAVGDTGPTIHMKSIFPGIGRHVRIPGSLVFPDIISAAIAATEEEYF